MTNKQNTLKFDVPLAKGKLTAHFGHCQEFAVIKIEGGWIINKETLVPPPHEPGVLPKWLHEQGVKIIIAGGMGQQAISFFDQYGIKVITGAPSLAPEDQVDSYLNNTLTTSDNICAH